MSDQKPRNEYDRVLNYIRLIDWKGNAHNILTQMVEFSYEEEIFKQTLHGSIRMFDTVDFPTLLPMIGEERVAASFTRQIVPSSNNQFLGGQLPAINFDMSVYCMEGKAQTTESKKGQAYLLKYTSELPFININTKIFAAYKNMTYSEMVQKIYDTYLKQDGPDKNSSKPLVNLQKTSGARDFYIQNLSPLAAIKKICQRATSEIDSGNMFVFYEDRDGYHFVTLGLLMKQPPVLVISNQLKNVSEVDGKPGSKNRDLNTQFTNVDGFTRNQNFNIFKSALGGEGTSSLLAVDHLTRQFRYKEFDLRDEWDKTPHLGYNKPWTDSNKMFINPLANMGMVITDAEQDSHPYIAEREKINPYTPEDFFLTRLSQKRQIMKNMVYTSLSGDTRVKAGSVIKFNVPENLGKTNEENPEELDRYMQGRYLVIGVLHTITQNSYIMHLELIKDGFHGEIKYRDPRSEYKNYWNA